MPPRRVDGIGQRDDVGDVPGRVVGTVEDDRDAGTTVSLRRIRRGLGAWQLVPGGQLFHRLEVIAGEQHGVGQEGVDVAEIADATVNEVVVGLGHHTERNRGQLHQCGVGGVLAAEDHQRKARALAHLEGLGKLFLAAEESEHHEVGSVEQLLDGVGGELDGIPQDVVGAARAGTQEIGLGGGEQGDAGQGVLRRDPRPGG